MTNSSTLPPRYGASLRGLALACLLGALFVVPWLRDLGPGWWSSHDETGIEDIQATPDSDGGDADPDPAGRREKILHDLGAAEWHQQGYRGQGVKLAVLDTGFCGYRAHLGKALPAQVKTKSFRQDGNLEARDSQHGILCTEVLHALAPDAELLLANWEADRPESFLEAVRWARHEGARVLSCSVIMPSWSDGEGHGAVHDRLADLLGRGDQAGDMLLCVSAGNTASRHWGGSFHDGGAGFHDWGKGQTENVVKPWGGERISAELCWKSGNNYELIAEDITSGRAIGRCTTRLEEDRCCCVVRFMPQAGHAYTLKLRCKKGPGGSFHLMVLGGGLQIHTRQGSIPFPGDCPEVIAVGAVSYEGRRLSYSSCGPNSASPKPDLVAAIPFPSLWRQRPFTGTSAAAPQAAGLAALVWSRHPDWKASKVRESLRSAAAPLGTSTHSRETGYGRVHLP